MGSASLFVNVDHLATLREVRGGWYPDPVEGAGICEEAGAKGITVHLREDRRHIQDSDVRALRKSVAGKFNLELALSDEIMSIALEVCPDQVTIVPERRKELTTEGGLDVVRHARRLNEAVARFKDAGILVSLFIEPDQAAVEASRECGADFIEIHTGTYCNEADRCHRAGIALDEKASRELERIMLASAEASGLGLRVNLGHGLNIYNTGAVLPARGVEELNIGHSIVSRAVIIGLAEAVREMIRVIRDI